MRSTVRLLVVVAALLGWTAAAATAATLRVVVAHYSDATAPVFSTMARDFEAANPGVQVVIEDVSWDNLQQRLTTDIAGGTAPDIAIIGTRWLLDYASQGVALPLDTYLTPAFKDRFIAAFLEPSVIDGRTWGLPVAASARAMYVNRALLAEAGVTAIPATWDELVAAARKVKALGKGAYGFGLQGKEIETDAYWYYALWTHGGELIEGGRSGIGSPAAIRAAALYRAMIEEGLTQPQPTGANRQDVETLFKQGRAAMILSGPWLRGQIAKEAPSLDYAIVPIPKATRAATYGVTDSIMIFASSKAPDLAFRFLAEAAFAEKGRRAFTVKEGFLPVTKAEAAAPELQADAGLAAFIALLPDARFAPLVPDWERMADITAAALQRIYLGEVTPEQALPAAAARIDALLR